MPLSRRPRSLWRLGAADRFGDGFSQPGIPNFRISDMWSMMKARDCAIPIGAHA